MVVQFKRFLNFSKEADELAATASLQQQLEGVYVILCIRSVDLFLQFHNVCIFWSSCKSKTL